jgi:hypothetical protein
MILISIDLCIGKPPLGFVNPLLYQAFAANASAFNDIVVGNNGAGQFAKPVCSQSFHATRGWDAASGLGSPHFPILSQMLFDPDQWLQTSGQPKDSGSDEPTTSSSSSSVLVITIVLLLILVVALVVSIQRRRLERSYQELEMNGASQDKGQHSQDTPGSRTATSMEKRAWNTEDDEAMFNSGDPNDDHDDEEVEVELAQIMK